MKKLTLRNTLIIVIVLALAFMVSCGGGSGSSSEPPVENKFEDLSATWNEDGNSLITADVDGNVVVGNLEDRSIVWMTPEGEGGSLFYGEDLFPKRVVAGDVVILYENWTETTVDLAIVSEDGYEVIWTVEIDIDLIAELIELSDGVENLSVNIMEAANSGVSLGKALKITGTVYSAAMCASGVTAVIFSSGALAPTLGFTCGGAILGATALLTGDETTDELSTGLTFVNGAISCGSLDVPGCSSSVMGVAGSVLEYADSTQDGLETFIAGATTELRYVDDLVAHYPFNGNSSDVSGNGNHATAVSHYSYESGIIGDAIHLVGYGHAGLLGGHVLLPTFPFNTMDEFTISMWVKYQGYTAYHWESLITFGRGGDNNSWYGISYDPINERIGYYAGGPWPTISVSNVTTPFPTDFKDNWHHLVLRIDNDVLTGFLDGQDIGSNSYTKPTCIFDDVAGIGVHWWGSDGDGTASNRFIGSIDDVRIYNRALSDEDISELAGISD